MSEELNNLLQVMQIYGRGLSGFGKFLKISAKGVKKGAQLIQIKDMQRKMRIHFATSMIEGDVSSMNFKDLEKLTGGGYKILNIPSEDKKVISELYQKMKKLKVPFSELPDLDIGDGYTQIAYDPNDQDKIRLVSDFFKEKLQKEAEEITPEQYEKMGEEKLKELASMGYKKESQMEQLSVIRQRNEDKNFVPISINRESLLVHESKDKYMIRLPQSLHQGNTESVIEIKKEDALLLDQGQTIYTHIDVRGELPQYGRNRRTEQISDAAKTISGKEICKHFSAVDKKTVDRTNHIRLDQTEHFPNFNEGEELLLSSPSAEKNKTVSLEEKRAEMSQRRNRFQDFPQRDYKKEEISSLEQALLRGQADNTGHAAETKAESVVEEILQREELKTKSNSEDFIPIVFDRDNLAEETAGKYLFKLPSDTPEEIRAVAVDKKDCTVKGNRITALLHRNEKSDCYRINRNTGKRTQEKLANRSLVSLAEKQSPIASVRPARVAEMRKGGILH